MPFASSLETQTNEHVINQSPEKSMTFAFEFKVECLSGWLVLKLAYANATRHCIFAMRLNDDAVSQFGVQNVCNRDAPHTF